ncbi:hypothetical protein HUU40_01285 [candidate division KSB1 bacterium]|nr:hypothetical protein [candidate division KSB1 bacterium]
MNEINRVAEMVEQLADAMKAPTEELVSIHKLTWDSSDNIAKTIISTSAVVMAFTITFSQSFVRQPNKFFWTLINCASWLFFAAAITAAIVSLWNTRQARSVPIRFLKNKKELREILVLFQHLDQSEKIEEWYKKTIGPARKNADIAESALKTSLILLSLAIVALTFIGIRQAFE